MLRPTVIASWVVLAWSAASLTALAQIVVTDAWVRGTVAGQKTTGAFMQMKSVTDVFLTGVTSPVARIVEVHAMKIDAGMMKMSAVTRLTLPAGKTVGLGPGGYHVMLMDLTQPLQPGDVVPLVLTFEDKGGNRQTVEVKAPVKALTAGDAAAPQR